MLRAIGLFTLALAVAGCSPTQGRQLVANAAVSPAGAAAYPARLAMTGAELPAEAAPLQPPGGAWVAVPGGLAFGLPGQAPLLSLLCSRDTTGAALVRLIRVTRADEGAQALMALIGNGRIARLPVDATTAGEAGTWEGMVPAIDPRLDVFTGSREIEATLPGGGTLLLPASGEPSRLLAACRASDMSQPAA